MKNPANYIGESFQIGSTRNGLQILAIKGDRVKVKTYAFGYKATENEMSLEEVTRLINMPRTPTPIGLAR